MKEQLLEIWELSGRMKEKLDALDKVRRPTKAQWAAIQSAQNSFRDFRGINLGELLNLFGLPPEKRK